MDRGKFLERIGPARRLTRNREFVVKWREEGGIDHILALLQSSLDAELLSNCLSTLANCILLDEKTRKLVIKNNGVQYLANILADQDDAQLMNRSARALANLFDKDKKISLFRTSNVARILLQRLSDSLDSFCLQSLLRALHKMAAWPAFGTDIVKSDYLKNVAICLNAEDEDIVCLALKVVQAVVVSLTNEIAFRFVEAGILEGVVRASNVLPVSKRETGIVCLSSLTKHPVIRISLTSIGGIELFHRETKDMVYSRSFCMSVRALCVCAKEAVNRNKITRCGALGDLVRILNFEKYSYFFSEIVAALVWFLFDETSMRVMVDGNVVKGLIKYFTSLTDSAVAEVENSRSYCQDVGNSPCHSCSTSCESFAAVNFSENCTGSVPASCAETGSYCTTDASLVEQVEGTVPQNLQEASSPILLHPAQPWPFSPGWSISSPETSPPGARSPDWSDYQMSPPRCYSPHFYDSFPPGSPEFDRASVLSTESERSVKSDIRQSRSFIDINDREEQNMDGPSENDGLNCESSASSTSPSAGCSYECSDIESIHRYCGSADGISAMIHGKRGPVHDVLLLLSRLSQMTDPSRILVNAQCIDALVNYIFVSLKPEPKAVRLLNRLTLNPNCFEAFFKHNLVMKIYLRLCKCYKIEELCRLLENARAVADTESKEEEVSDDGQNKIDVNMPFAHSNYSSKNTSLSETCIFQSWKPRNATQESLRTCELLLSNLRAQTESSFGKGVLTHVMLTRCQREKEIHAVALPLLCRSKSLLRKMFLELKTLDLLLEIISEDEPRIEMFVMACEGLSALVCLGFANSECLKNLCGVDKEAMTAHSSPFGSSPYSPSGVNNPTAETVKAHILTGKRPFKSPVAQDSKRLKVDDQIEVSDDASTSIFRLDSGSHIKVERRFLKDSSKVFSAMLSSRYGDSIDNIIDVKGVEEATFIILLHHFYGCSVDLKTGNCVGECLFKGHVFPGGSTEIDPRCCSYDNGMGKFLKSLDYWQCDVSCGGGYSFSRDECVLSVAKLLVCSERYMVECMKEKCEDWLISNVSEFNVVDIFLVACHCNACRLREYCMRYVFLRIKDPWLRVKSVREIIESSEKDVFVNGMRTFVQECILLVK